MKEHERFLDARQTPEIFERLESLERSRKTWRGLFGALVAILVTAVILGTTLVQTRQVAAQQAAAEARDQAVLADKATATALRAEAVAQKARRAEAPVADGAPGYEYRQSVVLLDRMAITLNEWADKGWEPVGIVFVPPSLGAGGSGQVAIAMRRLARPR